MPINITYREFCSLYHNDAVIALNKIVKDYIDQHGSINRRIDLELVKQLTLTYSLERVYQKYDVEREGAASIKTFLNTVLYNCFRTELQKQWTEVKRNHPELVKVKDKIRDQIKYKGIMTGIKGAGDDGLKREGHTYLGASDVYERKEEVLNKLMECVKKLNPTDQIILDCWMNEKRNYVDKALERLGLDITKQSQGMIRRRLDLAKAKLAKMMGGAKPDYRDVYIPSGEAAKDAIKMEPVDRNLERRRARAIKREMGTQVNYMGIAQKLYTSMEE